MPHPDGVEIANMYVGYNGITAQQPDESNALFRQRVSAVLREDNKIVDAHEVINNKYHDEQRHDDPTNPVMNGINGACALALSGHDNLKSTFIDNAANDLRLKRERDEQYEDERLSILMMMIGAMGGGR